MKHSQIVSCHLSAKRVRHLHTRQSVVLVCGFPWHGFVISKAVSNLQSATVKDKNMHTEVTQASTGIGEDKVRYLALDALDDSCLPTTVLQKTRPDTFLLRLHFSRAGLLATRFPLPSVAGALFAPIRTVFAHMSVLCTDWASCSSHGKVHTRTARHARCTHRHSSTWPACAFRSLNAAFLFLPNARVISSLARALQKICFLFSPLFLVVCQ